MNETPNKKKLNKQTTKRNRLASVAKAINHDQLKFRQKRTTILGDSEMNHIRFPECARIVHSHILSTENDNSFSSFLWYFSESLQLLARDFS